jgi:ABC-type multidrug transport system, ATPase and permease components
MVVAIEALLDIGVPTLMASLIDYGISQNNINNILFFGITLLACALLSLFVGLRVGRGTAIASAGFAKNLRRDIFSSVQKFSFSNIDKFSTAGIITRLTTDVSNIQDAFQMVIRLGVRCPMMILFALIFSARIDVRFSMFFFSIIPILGVGLWLIIRHVNPIFVRVLKTYDRLNNVVQENLLGIRVVKSYNHEEYEKQKFFSISHSVFQDFSGAAKRLAFNMPLMQLCIYVVMVLLSWFGAQEILAANNNPAFGLTTGELTSLITYSLQVLMNMMLLSRVFIAVIISRASAERVAEILSEESDLKSGDKSINFVKDGSITFENVFFSYSKEAGKPVLSAINLSIASGETVGILGGTGSSKSSLVQLIPRLYDVTDGRVTIGGIDVRDYDIAVLREQVAMVLQKNVLFSGTVRENLCWGNECATEEELVFACRLAQADKFIRAFPAQYDTYIEQGGTNISGGQRQRLCIARALLKNPKILILDDSTSAVDTKTDQLIRRALEDEMPDITKLIIAQRVASFQDAGKIIVLDDGKINAVGSHNELLKTCAIYREVYESQNKGGIVHA